MGGARRTRGIQQQPGPDTKHTHKKEENTLFLAPKGHALQLLLGGGEQEAALDVVGDRFVPLRAVA